jgi:Protein of unknown function (DUF2778)
MTRGIRQTSMWLYEQNSGKLTDPTGTFSWVCYSGCGAGLNNPAMEHAKNVGPIPRGIYKLGEFLSDAEKGPFVSRLFLLTGDDFGRSGFMIHGDNRGLDHTASEGCIIAPHELRVKMSQSDDRKLEVI